MTARRIYVLLGLSWIAIGLLGTHSYLQDYAQHRGFPPVQPVPGLRVGQIQWVHFFSAALRREADYMVYLPTGYNPERRYPVFYLLHGMPGRPEDFVTITGINVRLDNLISRRQIEPMILVFPDGRVKGSTLSDSEWANTPTGPYEDYVLEVVADVDARFPVIADRNARLIGGYSSGSLGALNIALQHPDLFASVQAWSGPFVESKTGPFAHASRAEIEAWSPLYYAAGLGTEIARYPMQAFLYGGRQDGWSWPLPHMAAALAHAGVSVQWAFYPGGHDWQLWEAHVSQMLVIASRYLSHPPPTLAARGGVADGIDPLKAIRGGWLRLVGGLLLALASAAAINLGFLLQSRGLRAAAPAGSGSWLTLRAAFRSRLWLVGQGVGWFGFAAQVIAVAIAPLSLVEAFAAGGLALSVPLAAAVLDRPIDRREAVAVLVIAAALASLPLGLAGANDHTRSATLVAAAIALSVLALPAGLLGSASVRAIAAGLLYGVADGAIKAISVHWSSAGAAALLSVWTGVAVLATFGGFLAFQAALKAGSAIAAISLMTALTTLVALALGLAVFGESLGRDPAVVVVHALALLVVLMSVPVLAAAHTELAEDRKQSDGTGRSGGQPSSGRGLPRADGSGECASNREQQRLEPRPRARAPAPEHLAEAEVAGQRIGSLRSEEEQDQGSQRANHGALRASYPRQRQTGDGARG